MLRIAVIAFEFPHYDQKTGGVSHFNERLCTELHKLGHDVTAYVIDQSGVRTSYKRVSLRHQTMEPSRIYRYYIAPVLARKWDFLGYDLVISNGDDWAMRRGTAWVRIMHGSSLRKAQRSRKMLHRLNHYLLYALESLSIVRSSVTFFNSEDTMRIFPRRSKDVVRSLPVDVDCFKPSHLKCGTPTILFVGGIWGRKRGALLLDLFESVITRKVYGVQLWMVSDEGRPIKGVTYFSKPPSVEQLALLYARAHVFCLPSEYEGFGLPYLEAMSSGTIVVSSSNPGAREVLADGKYGIIVADEELADALVQALENPRSYEDMRLRARQRATECSWEKIIPSYLSAVENNSFRGLDW